MTAPATKPQLKNPYVGPRTFSIHDGDRFFGREREARDLYSLVVSERLVLFYAQSGAGKSSLINARLIPKLRENEYAVLPVGRVSGELPEGVTAVTNIFAFNLMLSLDQSQGDPSQYAHMPLHEFLARLTSEDGRYYYYEAYDDESGDAVYEQPIHLLIIDQFEEIVTTHLDRWQERELFFEQLDEAMAADPLLWVVLTLREDFVAMMDPFAHLMRDKMRARFYMQRMGVKAAQQAIEKPAELFDSRRCFAPSVAADLVDNLREIQVQGTDETELGQFVEPVQLQVVCYQLWENLAQRRPAPITQRDVDKLANVDKTLAQFYEQTIDRALREVGGSEIHLRNWFDQELITEAQTRGTVYQGKEKTADLDNEVVRLLADRYLLRAERRAGGAWFELVHDRFVQPILQANQKWRTRQAPYVQAALAWDESGRDSSKLFLGEQLKGDMAIINRPPDLLVLKFLVASGRGNERLAQTEEARQRELERAKALAESEAKASSRLKSFLIAAGVLLIITVLAMGGLGSALREVNKTQLELEAAHVEAASIAAQRTKEANRIATGEAQTAQTILDGEQASTVRAEEAATAVANTNATTEALQITAQAAEAAALVAINNAALQVTVQAAEAAIVVANNNATSTAVQVTKVALQAAIEAANNNATAEALRAMAQAAEATAESIQATTEAENYCQGQEDYGYLDINTVNNYATIQSGCVHYWRFEAPAGLNVIIRMRSTDGQLDTYLRLSDRSQFDQILAENDDVEDSSNSAIEAQLVNGGSYWVQASGFGTSFGAYEIVIEVVEDDGSG